MKVFFLLLTKKINNYKVFSMKILLNIVIKVLLILGSFLMLDFIYSLVSYNLLVNKYSKEYKTKEEKQFFYENIKPKYRYFRKVRHLKHFFKDYDFLDFKGNKEDKSIILFGCSFAYGAFLEDSDTFAYKLSMQTGRTVYKRALCTMGFGQMLYLSESETLYNSLNDKPEYAIYVYIPDHLFRSCHYKYGVSSDYGDNYYLSYVLKSGKLEEKTPFINYLNSMSIFHDISKNIFCSYKNYATNEKENFDFIKAHFTKAKNNLQKVYPNLKFVIIKYAFNDNNPDFYDKDSSEYANMISFNSKRWKELEDEGFIVLDVKKLTGIDVNDEKYQLPDKHPNAKAWDIITPKVIDALKL